MAAVAMAQDNEERHYVKISYTTGHTVAVDSSGQEWYYDTESGEFVTEDEYGGSTARRGDPADEDDLGSDEIILPPELRCTKVHDGDITEIFSHVIIRIDSRIEGSVTSGKEVIVKGLVIGNVVSYGRVIVESTGEVRGDVIAKEIVRERGGRILGQRLEVPFPEGIGIVPSVPVVFPSFMGFIFTGFLVFICLITIALFPQQLGRVVAKIEEGTIKSFFWGVLGWFSILPVFALLIITIVGIPIAILIFPFVVLAAILLGYVSVAIFIGQRLSPFFNWQDKSVYIKAIIGVIVIAGFRLLANIFISIGAEGLGVFFGVVYWIVALVTITAGLGAAISSRFGARPKPAGKTPGSDLAPSELEPVPPVKPPPPPKSDHLPPQILAPPPPVPPPAPKSGNATDQGKNPSN